MYRLSLALLLVLLPRPALARADANPLTVTYAAGTPWRNTGTTVRTSSRTPTLGIESSVPGELTCAFGGSGPEQSVPCGPALPGCTAVLCASYSPPELPATRKVDDVSFYSLTVTEHDPAADATYSAAGSFAVDVTPPDSVASSNTGGAGHPRFVYSAVDAVGAVDTAQCSLVRLGAQPRWRSCPVDDRGDGAFRAPSTIPKRHIDWRFAMRAIDDFGRVDASPSHFDFDPVPCALRARAVRLGTLVSRGLPVTAACSYFGDEVDVGLYLLAKNGGRRVSVGFALGRRPLLARGVFLGRRSARITRHLRLRPSGRYAPYFRSYRSAVLLVQASSPGEQKGLPRTIVSLRR